MLWSLKRPPDFSSIYIFSLKLSPKDYAWLTPAWVSSPPHFNTNNASVTLSFYVTESTSNFKGLIYTFLFKPSNFSLSKTFLNWMSFAILSLSFSKLTYSLSYKLLSNNKWLSNFLVKSKTFWSYIGVLSLISFLILGYPSKNFKNI